LQGIRETGKRAAAFKAAAKKLGVKILGVYWTLGPFDTLIIFDAPDDETATAAMLNLAGQGNLTTTTVRAFTPAEIDKILAILGP
jgi:uncharacterized protein with GYD domain